MKRVSVIANGCLLVLCAYLTYRVFVLREQRQDAEYMAQSGLLSVQRACTPVIEALRASTRPVTELRGLAWGCLGEYDGDAGAKQFDALLSTFNAPTVADFIEHRLRTERRLPWHRHEPVRVDLMPAHMSDPNESR